MQDKLVMGIDNADNMIEFLFRKLELTNKSIINKKYGSNKNLVFC